MTPDFADILLGSTAALGISLTEAQIADCARYADQMLAFNAHTNLTRITEPGDIAIKHFADSLTLLIACPDIANGASLCDVGTGAGFPGLAVKIVRPDLKVTLIDSSAKKLSFLSEVSDALGLVDVTLLHARAEEAGREIAHRDRYHLVTARAVAALPTLLEWCGPLVRPRGRFVAFKTESVEAEMPAGAKAEEILNLHLERDLSLKLPEVSHSENESENLQEEAAQRRLLIYRKTALTPPRFPRRSAEIKSTPLGADPPAAPQRLRR